METLSIEEIGALRRAVAFYQAKNFLYGSTPWDQLDDKLASLQALLQKEAEQINEAKERQFMLIGGEV